MLASYRGRESDWITRQTLRWAVGFLSRQCPGHVETQSVSVFNEIVQGLPHG
jgi:hypothetical protein